MKNAIVVLLILLGIYWLVDHTDPLPFNHEQLGLFNHAIHRILGIVLIIAAGLVAWKWNTKKS